MVGPLIFEPLLTFIRGGGSRCDFEIRGGGRIHFRLSLSWVVGKIRGGVVDGVWKFEGG